MNDFDDTLRRLIAYRDAGADVLYAPGLVAIADVASMVEAVRSPVSVLLLPGGPRVAELAEAGVRRVSTARLARSSQPAPTFCGRSKICRGRR